MPKDPTRTNIFIRFKTSTGAWRYDKRLRPKLLADARKQDSNMTSVAMHILAHQLGVTIEHSDGRKTTAGRESDAFLLQVPQNLADAIYDSAGRSRRRSMAEESAAILCEHYGLKVR